MILIIAEKPSQAKEYANALGGFQAKEGYYQSQKHYITWCYGHLIELERDEKYREPGKWDQKYLPLIPRKYYYKIGGNSTNQIDSGKKKQISVIQKLMNNSTEIINATDADREGELIFRYVYNYLNCKLPFRRLWISSLTKGDILKGFQNLLPASEVNNLAKSAYARAIADWLIGVNGTQASTLRFGNGTLLTIGRVQTAILKIICERYLKNKNHSKTYTYKIRANHHLNVPFHSETEVFESKSEAEAILNTLTNDHICQTVDKQKTKQSPPLLHSIDTLIISANKTFKYTGSETLAIAQKLYEKKLTSYPRTDSEYINEENYDKLQRFIPEFAEQYLKKSFSFCIHKPKSVNTTKLTGSHEAIIPTGEHPELSLLTEKEINVYKLILIRCLQSFSDSAEYEKTKITFKNSSVEFYTYTSKMLASGWKRYEIDDKITDETESNEQYLEINIRPNDVSTVTKYTLKEIESKPPTLYSEVNLTKDLTNFGKLLKEENPELLQKIKSNIDINSLQIGTQATRPGIVNRLIKLEYIQLKSNKYIPTEKGLKYYDIIKDLAVSDVITTAVWEMKLKKVSEGKEDIKEFYKEITGFTEKIVSDILTKESKVSFNAEKKEKFGICPKCGNGQIFEGKKSYNCSKWKEGCDLTIWKTIAGKKISSKNVLDLIEKKQTSIIKGFKSKSGKSFDAHLEVDKEFKVKFKFKN